MVKRLLVAAVVLAVLLGGVGVAMWWLDVLPDPFMRRIPAGAFKLIPINNIASETAVVFVHGLDGHPTSTFQLAGLDSWAELMKKDDRPFPGVAPPPPLSTYATYALDYRLLFKSENTVEQAAQQIAERLRSEDLFKKHNHVWFIAHSLGGVLMKRVILLYNGQGAQRLLSRVMGVFLLGVPSQGAPLANLDDDQRIALLAGIFGRRYRVVQDLQPERAAAFLGGLEKSWGDFLRERREKGNEWPPYVHCAYEVDKTFAFVHVVPALYAQTECTDGTHPMSKTHISLVKPLSTDDQVYAWTRERLGQGRQRLRLWTQFEIKSGVEPLSKLAKDYQNLHAQPPDKSGLLDVPEVIGFADAASSQLANRLLLIDQTYRGTTAADVFENIASVNRCVSVKMGADRRDVSIGIAPPVTACSGDRMVCQGVPCPARPGRSRQ